MAVVLSAGDGDLDRLSKAAAACDRPAMTRAWAEEVKRHGDFVIAAIKDQTSIVADRQALVERRRKSRGAGAAEGEGVLGLASADLDERQRAVDDQRRLDTMRQDAVSYFRQQFILQCNGRDL